MNWRCITIYGMLIFLIILLLAASINFKAIKNRKKAKPANVGNSRSSPENRFKEEIAMENEPTEKEKKEKAKIEKVAASKADEEIAEELTPLKDQVKKIQSTLNSLKSNEQQTEQGQKPIQL